MKKIKQLIDLINRKDQSGYWIRKSLVYGITALLFIVAIIYALKRPYTD